MHVAARYDREHCCSNRCFTGGDIVEGDGHRLGSNNSRISGQCVIARGSYHRSMCGSLYNKFVFGCVPRTCGPRASALPWLDWFSNLRIRSYWIVCMGRVEAIRVAWLRLPHSPYTIDVGVQQEYQWVAERSVGITKSEPTVGRAVCIPSRTLHKTIELRIGCGIDECGITRPVWGAHGRGSGLDTARSVFWGISGVRV